MSPASRFVASPWLGAAVAIGVAVWEVLSSGTDGVSKYATLAVVLFLVSIGQTIGALLFKNNELSRKLDDQTLKRRIRDRLGALIQESKQIYDDHDTLPDMVRWEKWERKCESFLASEPMLGQSCVARFPVGAGIPIRVPEELESQPDTPDQRARRRFWCRVHTRRSRLIEFIVELGESAG